MTGIRRTPDAEVVVKNAYLCTRKRDVGTMLVSNAKINMTQQWNDL